MILIAIIGQGLLEMLIMMMILRRGWYNCGCCSCGGTTTATATGTWIVPGSFQCHRTDHDDYIDKVMITIPTATSTAIGGCALTTTDTATTSSGCHNDRNGIRWEYQHH
jgi:hypothetical protein